MRIIGRDQWGAQPARQSDTTSWGSRKGFCVHHSGASASQSVAEIQNYHMDRNGWWDIGYNFLVRESGDIYTGRGWSNVGAHAAGHNTAYLGVCLVGDYRNTAPSAAAKASLAYLYDEANRRKGSTLELVTHRQLDATACPGDELHSWVTRHLADHDAAEPSKPRPEKGTPAPGPAVAFPLPAGHYFGPKHGPDTSVSGFYERDFGPKTDREWLQTWVVQLQRRGWNARKGGSYLTRFGNDGKYGDEYERLIEAFQRDQGLSTDGLLGPLTWNAAYRNPVT